MTDTPTPPPPLLRRPGVRAGLFAILATAALATPVLLGVGLNSGSFGRAPQGSGHLYSVVLADSPDAIASDAVAQMQAIAQASASSMQQAGAQAVAEYEATGSEAAKAIADTQSQGDQQVGTVSKTPSTLQQPPEGTDVADVQPSADASNVPAYATPSPRYDSNSGTFDAGAASFTVTPYGGSDAQIKARVGLNIPQTGIAGIDSTGSSIVDLYIMVKGGGQDTGDSAAGTADDTTGGIGTDNTVTIFDGSFGTVTTTGENTTYQAAPDFDGAEAARVHAVGLLGKADATLTSLLSGVKASIAVEANLTAAVQAEIDATLEAEAAAEAALDAEADARVNATFAASAQAEAQAHAAAQRHVELVEEAHLAASQKVHAEAQQQVELVTGAAAQAQEQLRQQAAAAIQAGTQAAAQIHAAAEAAAQAIARSPGVNNTDAGARASAIMSAAAAAEAAAQAKANATASALLTQAAAVGAQVDVKVKALLTMEANAEAALDAKAKVAASLTLRAEAYTVAKIRVNAQAQAQAHLHAAAAAKAKMEVAAKAHIRAVIKAALGVNAAAKVSFDGSKTLGNQVDEHTYVETSRDIEYMANVTRDARESHNPYYQKDIDTYEKAARDLDVEKTNVLSIMADIEPAISEGLTLVAGAQHDLELLGQQYL
jgi:hypothetical protein